MFLFDATEHVHNGVSSGCQRFVHEELIKFLLFASSRDLALDVPSTQFEDNTSFIRPSISVLTDPTSYADLLLGDSDADLLRKPLPH